MFDFSHDRTRIAVILVDGFSMLSFGSIAEPIQFLAQACPDTAPQMQLIALSGSRAVSRGGIVVECDFEAESFLGELDVAKNPKSIVFCGGNEIPAHNRDQVIRLIRAASRLGITIYSIGEATLLLAETGLLKDGIATIHWGSLAAFSERHLDIDTRNALFVKGRTITTCAGEMATLDMILDMVADLAPDAAEAAANQLLIHAPRCAETQQPGSQLQRLRNVPKVLLAAVNIMVENIEDSLRVKDIARDCRASPRKLERLFRQHLGLSPLQYYRELKLERAFELVCQTNLSIQEVAIASGYSSAGTLSKQFKSRFGDTPTTKRMSLK
ncbi:MAG: helix-turn-helix domain-containing protein [Sedimentitalea sp.]|uniref:GlxA family transcriptional regulator n=1 Tax=Alphaproteobacteria TaxID=28211 RepID=UPI0032654B5B